MHKAGWRTAVVFGALVFLMCGNALRAEDEQKVDFKTDIQPIFAKSCYACHGEKKQESGLRLDRRTAAFNGGDEGPVIVAGKSTESRLVTFIAGEEPDRRILRRYKPVAGLRRWGQFHVKTSSSSP